MAKSVARARTEQTGRWSSSVTPLDILRQSYRIINTGNLASYSHIESIHDADAVFSR